MKISYLYYWNNIPNLGDELSFYIAKAISLNKIAYKNPFIRRKNLITSCISDFFTSDKRFPQYYRDYLSPSHDIIFAIGSILDWADKRTVVWGSGFRDYNSKCSAKEIKAVRGYRTRNLLDKKYAKIPVGDPALLLPLIIKKEPTNKTYKLSLIPHFKDKTNGSFTNSSLHIIDIQTHDVAKFVKDITTSECILTSSLHGLIISHAYGIPALWVKGVNTGSSDFKFYDYLSSVRLDRNYPIFQASNILTKPIDDILSTFESYKNFTLPKYSVITNIQSKLLESAPFEIRKEINI